jgi:hypothetical protein
MPPTPMPATSGGSLPVDRTMIGSRDGLHVLRENMSVSREGLGSRDGSTGVKYAHAPPMPPMTQAQINRKAINGASPLEGLGGGVGGMI